MDYKRLLTTKIPIRKNIDNGVSMCNEPVNIDEDKINVFLMKDIIQYPDMREVYKNFSETFNISKENFILTNGCEEALRLTSQLALRYFMSVHDVGTVLYEYPTWELAPIILKNSIDLIYPYSTEIIPDIYPINFKYDEKANTFYYDDNTFNILKEKRVFEDSLIYITDKQNNLFGHEDLVLNKSRIGEIKYIIDETYTRNKLFDLTNRKFDRNKFYIGSFSKNIGCGVRLGYILFNDCWYKLFNQYRPNYISSLAAVYASSPKLKKIIKPYSNYCNDKVLFGCDNFETIRLDDIVNNKDKNRINKVFEINGIKFARLGKVSAKSDFSKFINSKGDIKL